MNGPSLGNFTKARKKDMVRQSVANKRQRVNGLFVSKQQELQLKRNPLVRKQHYPGGSDCETDDPD